VNVVDPLFVHARERPAHPAIEEGERMTSYAGLASLVARSVATLQVRGTRRGDYVVVSLQDSTAHLVVLLALARLGAVSVSVDPNGLERDKAKAVDGLTVKAAIVQDRANGFLDLRALPVGWIVPAHAGNPSAARQNSAHDFDADLPMMMIQSSGTTGDPKRLLLTHRMVEERNRRLTMMMRLGANDRYLQVPCLRFAWGREVALLMLGLGATVVLNLARDDKGYARYFAERGITYVCFTPYHLRMMLACTAGETPLWPNLKIGLSSAPSTIEEKRLARRRLTPHLFEIYGTNEAADVALATPEDQERRPDSCGRLVAGIEAEIVASDGRVLPFGETGEIRFRGPCFPHEFIGNAEATARHFRDGWFYPGDVAALDEAGYVFLKGRTDQVINNAGAKFFPVEVEAALLAHPAITDAAVIGGAHPRLGEVSVAFVATADRSLTPNQVAAFCKQRIAPYKAPHWVFFCESLPRIATGKHDKRQLKADFLRYLERQKA